jgi:CheY-like chemotaxis protein
MLDWKNVSEWSVLVVDDEPDNLEVVSTVLSFRGMTVKTATDGLQGLEVLKNFTPTLILLDLAMPKMDGWKMFRHVRNNPTTKHIPIVALTAYAMEGDEEKILAEGFDGYLSKPVNLPTLLEDIEAAMTKKTVEAS